MGRVRVVTDCRANTGNLAGRDRGTDAGAADEDAALRATVCNRIAELACLVRVVDARLGTVGAEIDDVVPERSQLVEDARAEHDSAVIECDGDVHLVLDRRGTRTLQTKSETLPPLSEQSLVGVELIVVDNREEAAARAAALLVQAARDGLDIALAGGSTPRRAYELAADEDGDWRHASLWWGDERCVPPQDPRSNFRLAREGLLVRLAVPPAHVHRVLGELPPVEAAEAYERELRGVRLGLILLGLGPDGHTASLFPGSPALDEQERRVVAGPPGLEPMVDRVTMTVPTLNDAEAIVFLAVGHDKAEAAARAFGAAPDASTPASLVRSRAGTTTAILDREAAALL